MFIFVIILLSPFITMYTCFLAWATFKKKFEKKKGNKIILINKKLSFIYFKLGPVAVPKGIIVKEKNIFSSGCKSLSS